MKRLAPVSQQRLVTRLRRLGFEGPYSGGKHLLMMRGTLRLTIPNMHGVDIGVALLTRLLKQAAVTREEWERSE